MTGSGGGTSADAVPRVEPPTAPLPESLAGTRPPDVLRTDADGNLVVNDGLVLLFEYFLAATGEEPMEVIVARIHHLIQESLEPPALSQAVEILDRYVSYRLQWPRRESEMKADPSWDDRTPLERMASMHQVRRDYFQPEVGAALFSERERSDQFSMQAFLLERENELAPADRDRAMDAIFAALPAEERERRLGRSRLATLHHQVRVLREEGASPASIHALRVETLGEETARALAEIDRRWGYATPD